MTLCAAPTGIPPLAVGRDLLRARPLGRQHSSPTTVRKRLEAQRRRAEADVRIPSLTGAALIRGCERVGKQVTQLSDPATRPSLSTSVDRSQSRSRVSGCGQPTSMEGP